MNPKRKRLKAPLKQLKLAARNIEAIRQGALERRASRKINAAEFAAGEIRKALREGGNLFSGLEASERIRRHIIANLGLPKGVRDRAIALESKRVLFESLLSRLRSEKKVPRQQALMVARELVRHGEYYRSLYKLENVGREGAERLAILARLGRSMAKAYGDRKCEELVWMDPSIIMSEIAMNEGEVAILMGSKGGFYNKELRRAIEGSNGK